MSSTKTPALLPALGCLLGAWLAPHLVYLPLAALVALFGLSLALGRPIGHLLAACALATMLASVRAAPGDELGTWIEPAKPVEVSGRIIGHAALQDERYWVRFRSWTLRQGPRVSPREVDLWLSLPADVEAPVLGSRWRLRGFLKRSAIYANDPDLASRPPTWRLRVKSARFAELEGSPRRLAGLAASLRSRIEGKLESIAPHRRSPALVRALVLGDGSRLPKIWEQTLRRCGLGHLLAISGLHVGLLTVWVVLLAAPLPARARLAAAAFAVLAYLLLVGPRPSILRASAMAWLATLALLSERPPQTWNALAGGVFLLVLGDPSLIRDLGFQLSVAATAGVVAVAQGGRRHGVLTRALAISLAAQAATMPVLLPVTGAIHPGALVLNLVAIPWLAGFLVLAWLWTAAALFQGGLAEPLAMALEVAAAPLDGLAALPPSMFFSYGLGPGPLLALLAVPGLLLPALLRFFHRPRRSLPWLLVPLALAITGAGPGSGTAGGPVEMIVFDVGQGDAILLRDGPKAVLIDGGGWPQGDLGGRLLLPALSAVGVRRLDAVVLTHPDVDHCSGLVDVVRYVPAGELWMAPGWASAPCAGELLASPRLRWRPQWRGRTARVGRWRLAFLHPGGVGPGSRNDRSLVVTAEVFGRRILLTGDIEAGAERHLASAYPDLRADVLKLAHHGSKTSTGERFLDHVRPSLAVVSAGTENPYGHPHPAVSRRLRERSIVLLRTDRSGAVRLRFDPSGRIDLRLPAALEKIGAGRHGER